MEPLLRGMMQFFVSIIAQLCSWMNCASISLSRLTPSRKAAKKYLVNSLSCLTLNGDILPKSSINQKTGQTNWSFLTNYVIMSATPTPKKDD